MPRKKVSKSKVSALQLESLSKQLENNPELFARISDIVSLTASSCSDTRTLDDIEAELIPKINQLGKSTLKSACSSVEDVLLEKVKSENETLNMREKKS